MPYRQAHWYLLAIFPLAGLAFWQSYFSHFAAAPMAFHAHGMTASLWLTLLTVQSWTIHHERSGLHRQLGLGSLALFPLFLAGGATIFVGMAQRFVGQVAPFYTIYAPRLAWLDVVAVAGFAYCYFQALRQRQKVHPHSRYMLSTVFFLLPPILGRLAPALPPLTPSGPSDFWKLGVGFQLANAIAAGIPFFLAWRAPKQGRPFLEVGALIVSGAILYQTVGAAAVWRNLFAQAANIPAPALAIVAGVAGALIGYAGWIAGKRQITPPGTVPA
nr:hypothetical protein [Sphingomonas sp.]